MKKYVNKKQGEGEEYKVRDLVLLSIKDLKCKMVKRRLEKLIEQFMGPYITNFIWTITPGILDRFRQSKWPPKALKKTFQTVQKMSQRNQYSLSYQQISQ